MTNKKYITKLEEEENQEEIIETEQNREGVFVPVKIVKAKQNSIVPKKSRPVSSNPFEQIIEGFELGMNYIDRIMETASKRKFD